MLKTFDVYFLLTKDGKLNAWSPTPSPGFIPGKLTLDDPKLKRKMCDKCYAYHAHRDEGCPHCGDS